jgi:hypothetical protein
MGVVAAASRLRSFVMTKCAWWRRGVGLDPRGSRNECCAPLRDGHGVPGRGGSNLPHVGAEPELGNEKGRPLGAAFSLVLDFMNTPHGIS